MAVIAYGLAALAYLGYAASLFVAGRHGRRASPQQRAFALAVLATGAWAVAAAAEPRSPYFVSVTAVHLLDALRFAAWYAFVWLLLRDMAAHSRSLRLLALAAPVAVGLALLVTGLDAWAGAGSRWQLVVWLMLSVLGLLLVEQLFRNAADNERWRIKPVCLALAIGFTFDVYLYTEAALFGRADSDSASVRGGVYLLAVPLLFIATRRNGGFAERLNMSRSAALYSATLVLVGAYLLFMAGVGYWVRYFGGDWGRALQIALLAAAGTFLAALSLSGSLRARVRVFVGKHFLSYRYDYREEWLRFTALLSTQASPQEMGALIVRGLADLVESPAGVLWMRSSGSAHYRPEGRWNKAAQALQEPADSLFSRFLADQGWVVDMREYRQSPRRYREFEPPAWLLEQAETWLVVPLLAGDDLLGFVTLDDARARMDLNWEVRDLLKTAGRQAAGFLAQMQAAEALLEARKFDAFNRMSAFVVHDLKNIVTQLSLMMRNAQRLRHNPEFQEDMLATVESSLEKMRRLMLQLREGAPPPGGAHGVELAPIAARLAAAATAQGRRIETEAPERLATRGHDERLERVLGHLVQNALDATKPSDRVWLKAQRVSGQVLVEVGDTGIGMAEDFVRNRLFRPFNSTKASGMGIGSYETHQYIRELGGRVDVRSRPGEGTVIQLTIPLFEAQPEPTTRD